MDDATVTSFQQRRLAAIMATDVVGYSRMMSSDELGTLQALKSHQEDDLTPAVAAYSGRIVKYMGDGALIEFASVLDAVACALDIQNITNAKAATCPAEKQILLRIGIHLGDVIFEGNDVFGNGVITAARLEPLADPGGICISSLVKESIQNRLEATFEYAGDTALKNLDGKVSLYKWRPHAHAPPDNAAPQGPRAVQAATASIAILPFDNRSGSADQDYFADGITEDIITDLSKLNGLKVATRNASFGFKGKDVDIFSAGRHLNVETVMEGSVRQSGNRVRITVQLVEIASRTSLWSERFDRELNDIFEVQDEVARQIVDAMGRQFSARIEQPGSGMHQTSNVAAHDAYLRARFLSSMPDLTPEQFRIGVEWLDKATGYDPNYAKPFALLAIFRVLSHLNASFQDGEGHELERAEAAALTSVKLSPNEPDGYQSLAIVRQWQGERDVALSQVTHAIELNPGQAEYYFTRGSILVGLGRPEDAISDLEQANRLDPTNTHQTLHYLGLAHLFLGNLENAKLMFTQRLSYAKDTDVGRAMLAATFGLLGQYEDARRVWADLRNLNPDFDTEDRLSKFRYSRASDIERIRSGLSKAGILP
ncbi:adenylate/guanylate cyclase domain-containing protein [Tateyamaria pelophila]|uniref:adenylate/guanylate cyclase domain-containing protein n=1 Tax=Tateyamaria pelophila TaxID=328415 RepID=UPI001CBC1F1F|nr:adenylate/guanylate cyclase domain-containing protein [Tateyamaria pelophila]